MVESNGEEGSGGDRNREQAALEPFWYELPRERIAQRPVEPRDSARLLRIDRATGDLSLHRFTDIPGMLHSGDVVVFNDTTVRPARLFGSIAGSSGEIELLLLEKGSSPDTAGERWRCIGRPMKRLIVGVKLLFPHGLAGIVVTRNERDVEIEFFSGTTQCCRDLIHEVGSMPIPPYIRSGRGDESDRDDYQSIFAEAPDPGEGSIAAPTASLHFTHSLVSAIREGGAHIETITLEVGLPSIRPLVREDEPRLISTIVGPGKERYRFDPPLLKRLEEVRRSGGRVIAVGTTVARALESMARVSTAGRQDPCMAETELFIAPGFEFRVVDAMVTNFHQPGSSHLLLLESFLGRALLASSYTYALKHEMRFLSYGDGMVVF